MPSPNPSARREYKGAAVATTLNGSIVSGATSFVIVSSAGWPTGAVGNFIVTIDRGLATEERVKCSAQSAGTVTVAASGRGFDSTTAQAHANGATVECTLSAFDADEWNQHTNATTAVHGVAGAVMGTTDTQTATNKTFTAPAINSGVLDAASTIGGVSGTTLAADRTAWTDVSGTLTLTNVTGNGYTMSAFQRVIGKYCTVVGHVTFSNVSTALVTLGGLTAYAHGTRLLGHAWVTHASAWAPSGVFGNGVAGGTTAVFIANTGNPATTGYWGSLTGFGSGDAIDFDCVYETT